MLTNAILNNSFEILSTAKNADEAIAQITSIFADNKIETSNILDYLLVNASTIISEDDDNSPTAAARKELQDKRNVEVANFLSLEGSGKYFNYLNDKNFPAVARMLSSSMFWNRDVILAAINITENIGSYKDASNNNLFEYFLGQRGFSREVMHAGEIAIALLDKGCSINFSDKKTLEELSAERAIESNLTINLCNYFIDQESNPELLFALVDLAEKNSRTASASLSEVSSRRMSASSLMSGTASSIKHIEALAKKVIGHNLKNGKINKILSLHRSNYKEKSSRLRTPSATKPNPKLF